MLFCPALWRSVLQNHWSESLWRGSVEVLAQDVTKWKHAEGNQKQYNEDGKWLKGNGNVSL